MREPDWGIKDRDAVPETQARGEDNGKMDRWGKGEGESLHVEEKEWVARWEAESGGCLRQGEDKNKQNRSRLASTKAGRKSNLKRD